MKCFSLIKWYMFILWLPLSIFVFPIYLSWGDYALPGVIISWIVAVLFSGVFIFFFFSILCDRKTLLQYAVEASGDCILWRDRVNLEGTKSFLEFLSKNLENDVVEKLQCSSAYATKKLNPVTKDMIFFTLLPRGKVYFYYFGKKYRVRGLQKGKHVALEWLGEKTSLQLARHELSHYYLSRDFGAENSAWQHAIMSEVGLL